MANLHQIKFQETKIEREPLLKANTLSIQPKQSQIDQNDREAQARARAPGGAVHRSVDFATTRASRSFNSCTINSIE